MSVPKVSLPIQTLTELASNNYSKLLVAEESTQHNLLMVYISLADLSGSARDARVRRFQILLFSCSFSQTIVKQVCIPVGCVPPTSVATMNRMTDRKM